MSIPLKKIFTTKKTPIWLMRQAGRYLPEYREVRKNVKNFLEMCYDPELTTEITLQPIRRFNLDAAIIFSDILVIPDALGVGVSFKENIGPVVTKITKFSEIPEFNEKKFLAHLSPIYQAITKTKSSLPKGVPLIGFIGAPWTVSTYLFEGGGSKAFNLVKQASYTKPEEFQKIIDCLVTASIIHLKEQIKAGADIVQIFDSWAGILDHENFVKWVIEPTVKIIAAIKQEYPNIPIIGFPKGAGVLYKQYIEKTKIDIIGLDSNIPSSWIMENIGVNTIVQGFLDPIYLLLDDKKKLAYEIEKILYTLKNYDHIFNLGHGILPNTPLENVEFLIKTIREYEK